MEIIKSFENELGIVELQKHGDMYAVVVHSCLAGIDHYIEHKYKQPAIAMFQSYHYWLVANV